MNCRLNPEVLWFVSSVAFERPKTEAQQRLERWQKRNLKVSLLIPAYSNALDSVITGRAWHEEYVRFNVFCWDCVDLRDAPGFNGVRKAFLSATCIMQHFYWITIFLLHYLCSKHFFTLKAVVWQPFLLSPTCMLLILSTELIEPQCIKARLPPRISQTTKQVNVLVQ